MKQAEEPELVPQEEIYIRVNKVTLLDNKYYILWFIRYQYKKEKIKWNCNAYYTQNTLV